MENPYQKNRDFFIQFNPDEIANIDSADISAFEFCYTEQGEVNLVKNVNGKKIYYHSVINAAKEAEDWFNNLTLLNYQVIFIYGLGLGYYYKAAKNWLRCNPDRFLIFFEDDPSVIRKFLETENATELLLDPQVIIKAYGGDEEHRWESFHNSFYSLFLAFFLTNVKCSALGLYLKEKSELFIAYEKKIGVELSYQQRYLEIYFNNVQELNVENNYRNLPYLSKAYFGPKMYQQFKDIPAIICGAGPSLAKHFSFLKTIEDRALIFGAGTAVNVLTRNGIIPHFGTAFDPTPTQKSRQRTNFAFELPFFYRNSFYHGALLRIHGPKLYLNFGFIGHKLQEWFEDKLDLHSDIRLRSLFTSSLESMLIAKELGCRPIILIGMDLAFTETKRYGPGVSAHTIDIEKEHREIAKGFGDRVTVKDIHGNEVEINIQFAFEASLWSDYAISHPETVLVNGTEGGVPIQHIPNMTFSEAAERFLKHSFNLKDRLHAIIQNSPMPETVNEENIFKYMGIWEKSLLISRDICEKLRDQFEDLKKTASTLENVPEDIFTSQAALLKEELHSEIVYVNMMNDLSMAYDTFTKGKMLSYETHPFSFTKKEHFIRNLEREIGRYNYFLNYIHFQLKIISDSKKDYQRRKAALGQPNEQATMENLEPEAREERPLPLEGKKTEFYPDGSLFSECFYTDGKLHGPSTFYSKNGKLLAKSWFVDGRREGKSFQYYPNGNLYSLQYYKNGSLHDLQEYYYPDGTLKTILVYAEGILDGDVRLFYPNGKPMRLLQLSKGILHGFEREWNEHGILILEAKYNQNKPVDKITTWHSNGQTAKEVIIHLLTGHSETTEWDESGNMISKVIKLPDNLMAAIDEKSSELNKQTMELKAKIAKLLGQNEKGK